MLTSPLSVALHRLGVETKVFGVGGAVGPLTDSTVRNYAAKTLGEEFYLDADVKVEMMQREGDKVFIRYQDLHGKTPEIRRALPGRSRVILRNKGILHVYGEQGPDVSSVQR